MVHPVLALTLAALFVRPCASLDNGLALKPAMGFNTWSSFALRVNEEDVRQTADLLVSLGLKDMGYTYLVLDDGWSEHERTPDGDLVADYSRFPGGMAALAGHIHARNLSFGMYADSGTSTCGGYPGSRGFEARDAAAFAGWGADYLKYDNCYPKEGDSVRARYGAMRDALNATGRPILFSLCEWGVEEPWLWGRAVGNSWRTTGDSSASWLSLVNNLDNSVGLARYAGPGAWNDPDMLQVGNPGLTLGEQRANLALWSLLKSPLMISTRLQELSNASAAILMAAEVVAINQDDLGVAGDLIWKQGSKEIYAGPLAGGDRAVVFFNRAEHDEGAAGARFTLRTEQVGYQEDTAVRVRDLYARRDIGTFRGRFSARVPPHDVLVLRLTPEAAPILEWEGGRWPRDDGWRPWTGQAIYAEHEEDLENIPRRKTEGDDDALEDAAVAI
uniref:Alpha-galactosidase n=1 Tax=Auxenochlorella protothecoides TaxID=3075 RepID=A0A1D2A6Z5_AUXPR